MHIISEYIYKVTACNNLLFIYFHLKWPDFLLPIRYCLHVIKYSLRTLLSFLCGYAIPCLTIWSLAFWVVSNFAQLLKELWERPLSLYLCPHLRFFPQNQLPDLESCVNADSCTKQSSRKPGHYPRLPHLQLQTSCASEIKNLISKKFQSDQELRLPQISLLSPLPAHGLKYSSKISLF